MDLVVLIRENLVPMCPVSFHLKYKYRNSLKFSKEAKCEIPRWWLQLTAQGLETLSPSQQGSWWPGAGEPLTEFQPGTKGDSKTSGNSFTLIPEQKEQRFGNGNQD